MTGCQSIACQRGEGGSSGLGSQCLCFCEQRVNPKTGEVSDTPVGMMDVYQEFNELSEKFKIMKYKSKVRITKLLRHNFLRPECNCCLFRFLFLESGEELRI